jgi:hypothetical protein
MRCGGDHAGFVTMRYIEHAIAGAVGMAPAVTIRTRRTVA